jgi:hypothetical protein
MPTRSTHATGLALFLAAALGATATPCRARATPGPSKDDLSEQATDPAAALMAFNLVSTFTTSYHGTDGSGVEVKLQPTIPFRAWGTSNILRLSVPYQVSGPGADGLGSVTIFELVVLPQSWGRLLLGADLRLTSGTADADGGVAVGPAFGALVPLSKRLNVGLFSQNLFGDGTALSQLQPIVAYQLGNGWAVSAGDLQFVYDWDAGRFVSFPIGAQIGVVTPVAGQPFRFSLNPQYNLADATGTERFKVLLTVTLLAPAM